MEKEHFFIKIMLDMMGLVIRKWENGKPHGEGRMIYQNGDIY